MGTFSVSAGLANPQRAERRLSLDLLVDTGATWTMLPADVVSRLGLSASREQMVTLANGERVTYPAGQVAIQLNGEEIITIFLAGPADGLALLGAVTLEEFGLAPDPIRKTLVPVGGLLIPAELFDGICRGRKARAYGRKSATEISAVAAASGEIAAVGPRTVTKR